MAEDSASLILIAGGAIIIAGFVGYRYYKQRKKENELYAIQNPEFPGNLQGQIINQGERPFGFRPYTDDDQFGVKFNDRTSENFHIQNNRTRAIAMAYRFIVDMSWLPVDPIGTRQALDELSRIKNQNDACASTIYDNIQILIFQRGQLMAEEEDEISIAIAKAYIKYRGFTFHPGINASGVC